MIQFEDILNAYFRARKNKKKSPDQVEFQLHWERNCLRLFNNINARKFKPSTYAFVTLRPKPREIFACDMATRVVHHYIDIRVRDILENYMSPNSYNNRIGKGTSGAIKAVQRDIEDLSQGYLLDDVWIIKLDLKACFPSIPREQACKYFLDVVMPRYNGPDKDDLKYLIEVCMLHDPCENCEKRGNLDLWKLIPPHKSLFQLPKGVGAAIGHLIWQNGVNLFFQPLDEYLESLPGIYHTRYVDDIYIITQYKDFFLSKIPEIRKLLATLGASLNENKFYCQHYKKGVECLGSHLKFDRIHLNNRSMWRAYLSAQENNVSVEKKVSSINSYLGLTKFGNGGFRSGISILTELNDKWWGKIYFDPKHMKIVARK